MNSGLKPVVRMLIVASWFLAGVFMAMLAGCSSLDMDLSDRTLKSNRTLNDLDIGRIEYTELADGSTTLIIENYQIAQQRMWVELGKLAGAVGAGAGVTP